MRYDDRRRRRGHRLLTVLVAGLALSIILGLALFKISKSRSFQFFGGIVRRVETREKAIALTLDDGPAEYTDEVLGILKRLGVRGTFFVTGAELENHPDLGRRIVLAGHELGNHSYSHRRLILVSPRTVRDEVERTDRLIRGVDYRGEILFRPPNCKKLFVLPYYLRRHHRRTITWDLEPDSLPGIAASSERIVGYVTEHAAPGSIILLHVMYRSRRESREAIAPLVAALRAKGYRFVTVSRLLGMGAR